MLINLVAKSSPSSASFHSKFSIYIKANGKIVASVECEQFKGYIDKTHTHKKALEIETNIL